MPRSEFACDRCDERRGIHSTADGLRCERCLMDTFVSGGTSRPPSETRAVEYTAVVDGETVAHTVTVEKPPEAAFTRASQRCYAGVDLMDRYDPETWDAGDIDVRAAYVDGARVDRGDGVETDGGRDADMDADDPLATFEAAFLPDWEWEAFAVDERGVEVVVDADGATETTDVYFGRVRSPNTYGRWEVGTFSAADLRTAGAFRTDADTGEWP